MESTTAGALRRKARRPCLFGPALAGLAELTMPERSNPWHDRLYQAWRLRPTPLAVFPDRIIPAASLWTGVRQWTLAFRSAGLGAGSRVLLALPPGPAFLMVLGAALWEQLTLAIAPPVADTDALLEELDTALAIGVGADGPGRWTPDWDGMPPESASCSELRPTQHAAEADIRLLLRSSGTSGHPRWAALSDENVLSVIDSHAPHLGLADAAVLSVLPWHHAFGLVIDLLPALMGRAGTSQGGEHHIATAMAIVRERSGGRDPAAVVDAAQAWDITHMSMVPLQVGRLLDTRDGTRLLRALRGGVVGGAPAGASMARELAQTRLRAGYGQTEASPGVTLGLPGEWAAGFLGRPVGCKVQIEPAGADRIAGGRLMVNGGNVCAGFWTPGGLERHDPRRWLDTGDIARAEPGGLVFLGRADHDFKLSNGRLVRVGTLEAAIRRSLEGIDEVVVSTDDGETIDVRCVLPAGQGIPSAQAVRLAMGELGPRLGRVLALADGPAIRTSKGAVDRRRLAA